MPRAARVREDDGMTADEADRLARENLWRCRALARRMTRDRPRLADEAESVALVGLATAVQTFVPDRDPDDNFAAYSHITIRNAILNYLHSGEAPKGYRRRRGLPRPVARGWSPRRCWRTGRRTWTGRVPSAGRPNGRSRSWPCRDSCRGGAANCSGAITSTPGVGPCGPWRGTWAWVPTTSTRCIARPWPCCGRAPRRGA